MKILDSSSSLDKYLMQHKQKKIYIVSAFASGTEEILSTLLDNGNTIDLIVGTINAFTSPKFIEYCAEHDSKHLKAFVDFRYQSSIHWKLYLISPNIVVIGSPNFTTMGTSLARDTCLVVNNYDIYETYVDRFKDLLNKTNVISVKSKAFKLAFKKYCIEHDRTQAGLARSQHYSTLEEWFSNETNQQIQLFIWDSQHTPETKTKAEKLLEDNSTKGDTPTLRNFFTDDTTEDELPYSQGDVVLCASRRGGHLDFYTFDRIIPNNGCHFIYSYRRGRYQRPFNLEEGLKEKLKKLVVEIYKVDPDDIPTHIDRKKLQKVLSSLRSDN